MCSMIVCSIITRIGIYCIYIYSLQNPPTSILRCDSWNFSIKQQRDGLKPEPIFLRQRSADNHHSWQMPFNFIHCRCKGDSFTKHKHILSNIFPMGCSATILKYCFPVALSMADGLGTFCVFLWFKLCFLT